MSFMKNMVRSMKHRTDFFQSSLPNKNIGPVIRVAPNLLSLSETAFLPIVYHAHADKTPFYSPFIAGGEPALLQIQEDKS